MSNENEKNEGRRFTQEPAKERKLRHVGAEPVRVDAREGARTKKGTEKAGESGQQN